MLSTITSTHNKTLTPIEDEDENDEIITRKDKKTVDKQYTNNNNNNNNDHDNNNNHNGIALPHLEQQKFIDVNINSKKRKFVNISQNSSHNEEIEKHNNNPHSLLQHHPHKRQKITTPTLHQQHKFTLQDTKMRINRNIRHFNTMSDDELCRQISEMKNNMHRSVSSVQKQSKQAMDLIQITNERYLSTKQQLTIETQRANHFQMKFESLSKQMIQHQNALFKIMEDNNDTQ